MSDTPRTDELRATICDYGYPAVEHMAELARQLERELSESRRLVEETIERCAKVAEDVWRKNTAGRQEVAYADAAQFCAFLIRALKRTGGEGATSPSAESAKPT